jgi:hypothetical protein
VSQLTERKKFLRCLAEFNQAGARLCEVWDRAQKDLGVDIGVEDYPFPGDFGDVSLAIMNWSAKQHDIGRALDTRKVDGPWLVSEGQWMVNVESPKDGIVTLTGFRSKEAAAFGAVAFIEGERARGERSQRDGNTLESKILAAQGRGDGQGRAAAEPSPGASPTGEDRRDRKLAAREDRMIGIPFAARKFVGRLTIVTCPACGLDIELRQRKDEDSFSGREYADHWERLHTERPIVNTHEQLAAAGGGVAIMKHHSQGRDARFDGWCVYRLDAKGLQIATDAKAAWYNNGKKVFHKLGRDATAALEEAKAWVLEAYQEAGPWKSNGMGDYVPERIAKAHPLKKSTKRSNKP